MFLLGTFKLSKRWKWEGKQHKSMFLMFKMFNVLLFIFVFHFILPIHSWFSFIRGRREVFIILKLKEGGHKKLVSRLIRLNNYLCRCSFYHRERIGSQRKTSRRNLSFTRITFSVAKWFFDSMDRWLWTGIMYVTTVVCKYVL